MERAYDNVRACRDDLRATIATLPKLERSLALATEELRLATLALLKVNPL
jgi:hypothetical protein